MIPSQMVIMRYARRNKFYNVKKNMKVKTLLRKITYCDVDKSQIVIQIYVSFSLDSATDFSIVFLRSTKYYSKK